MNTITSYCVVSFLALSLSILTFHTNEQSSCHLTNTGLFVLVRR